MHITDVINAPPGSMKRTGQELTPIISPIASFSNAALCGKFGAKRKI